MTRLALRALAALALLVLLWWLLAAGLWDVAALCLLSAGLAGVAVRPAAARQFRPTYWERRDVRVKSGE